MALNQMAAMTDEKGNKVQIRRVILTPEQERRRRQRNIAIGVAVGFLVLLFYVVTIVKLGPGVFRPDGP